MLFVPHVITIADAEYGVEGCRDVDGSVSEEVELGANPDPAGSV